MPAAVSDAISVIGMNRSVMSAAQSTQGASTRPLSDAARFVKTQPSAVERTQATKFSFADSGQGSGTMTVHC